MAIHTYSATLPSKSRPLDDNVAAATLDPDSDLAGSPFTVHLSNVQVDEGSDMPVEVIWDWGGDAVWELIGQGHGASGQFNGHSPLAYDHGY